MDDVPFLLRGSNVHRGKGDMAVSRAQVELTPQYIGQLVLHGHKLSCVMEKPVDKDTTISHQ